MGHGTNGFGSVVQRVANPGEAVGSQAHNNVANLIKKFLLAASLRERLVAGTQGAEGSVEPAKFTVNFGVTVDLRTKFNLGRGYGGCGGKVRPRRRLRVRLRMGQGCTELHMIVNAGIEQVHEICRARE